MCKEYKYVKPLIHCITNPIAMNQSANAVLAVGGRPMMAEHPKEVAEITETAGALLMNFGNISDTRMEAMLISGAVAKEIGIPAVIDVCGVACSRLRVDFFNKLIAVSAPRVIKGNYSEVLALDDSSIRGSGIDAADNIMKDDVIEAAKRVADRYQTMVLATGPVDILATDNQVREIAGGCKQLGSVTGTGCMLGAIVATFLAMEDSADSVEKATRFFGECGARAQTDKGGGTFMVNLLDRLGEYDGVKY
ncbi:MAG: hydroxyethylthiazole kinase [Pseudobutyrivibrio sp.]|nr:hydroxyethylthiazole kinase [Pseudobutyrivibrio sp.]